SLRWVPAGRNVTLGPLEDHQRLLALSQILPMRIGTREMAFNHSVWSIVLEYGWQMSGIKPGRARRYERSKRPGPHQRMHLRHILDAIMIGLVRGDPSALMLAALIIGHHFSISACCCAASACGVCLSRGQIS